MSTQKFTHQEKIKRKRNKWKHTLDKVIREGKLRLEGPCKEHEGDCYKQKKTLCKAPELERAW